MIVVAEAVTAIAAAIAIWLMSHACFGRPLVGMVVNVTFGRSRSSCVIRGNCCGCSGISSSAEMRSRLSWMAGTCPGVLFLVFCRCVRDVCIRFLLAVGSRACIMAGCRSPFEIPCLHAVGRVVGCRSPVVRPLESVARSMCPGERVAILVGSFLSWSLPQRLSPLSTLP